MKYIFDIKTLLLSLALLFTGAFVTSCNDDDDDIVPADALFRPIVGETTVGGQWIELEWDRYEGAETFVLTLSGKPAGQAEPTELEVETDTTYYRFEGLEYDTEYTIKIKSVGKNLESRFYNLEPITTNDYPTMLKGVQAIDNKALVSWENATYTSLNLVEVVTPEGSTLSEEVEISNYTVTDEDQAAGKVIFSNLTPESQYIVRAYNNGVYQGKKVFNTAKPESYEGVVVNLRDLPADEAYKALTNNLFADNVAANPDQDITIVLAGGMKYEMNGFKLPATAGTIKLVTGLSLEGNAILEVNGNYDIAGNLGGFVAEKITFTDHPKKLKTSSNFGGTYLFNLDTSNAVMGKMEYINCDIRYKRGVVRSKNSAVIDNFVMENCFVDSIGGYGITNADNNGAQVNHIKIKNSTFAHCEKLFVSAKNSAKTMGSFSAENCTFVYNLKGGANYLFDFNGMKFSGDAIVKNCIFGAAGKDNKSAAICGYRAASPAAITVDNCYGTTDLTWYVADGATAPAAPLEMNSTGADTAGTFANAAKSNFTLLINDLKEFGDPRWW